MPLPLLAHGAPVLPLKLWWPRLVNGTALVIGSIAPDAEYVWFGHVRGDWGHSMPGLLTFCLPVTLVLHPIVTRVIARPLAAHLPQGGSWRWRDLALVTPARATVRSIAGVALWGTLGAFTHLVWDAWASTEGWSAVMRLVATGRAYVPTPTVMESIQPVSSLLGALVTFAILWQIGSRGLMREWSTEQAVARPLPRQRAWFWPFLATVAVTMSALAVHRRPNGFFLHEPAIWVIVAVRTTRAVAIALIAACAAVLVTDGRARTE